MKAINELLKKQARLESEVSELSNGRARVGMREDRIEIDITGMSEANARELFTSANKAASEFIKTTKTAKESELEDVNKVLNRIEEVLNGEPHV